MFVQETFYKKYYIFKINTTLQQPYKIILINKFQSLSSYVCTFVKKNNLYLAKPLTLDVFPNFLSFHCIVVVTIWFVVNSFLNKSKKKISTVIQLQTHNQQYFVSKSRKKLLISFEKKYFLLKIISKFYQRKD